MAEAIVFSTTGQFALFYYNQILGVRADLVGLAIAAGLILNALFEPFVGSWSDRTRSRFGRRHPFMFAAVLPITASFWAMFSPPTDLPHTAALIWLAASNTVLLQALTAFHTPHLAFGGELSADYTERSRVMSWNTFFLWAGDTSVWLLSFGWFFRATPGHPNGALQANRWPNYIGFATIFVLLALTVSSVFTRSRIPYVQQAPLGAPRFSVAELFRDIGKALANGNFRMLLGGYLFLSLTSGVRAGLWLYTATYFWRLRNDQISWFAIGSFISYVLGSSLVAHLHGRIEKRWTGAAAVLMYSVGPAIPLTLGYFGILGPDTRALLPILIAFAVLQHFPYSVMTTTVYSTMADIADQNELRFGIRQEGILYSTSTLFAKIDQALGSAVAGLVLTLIAFPVHAKPGAVPQSVLLNLAAAFILFALPGMIAAVFYARINISRASHAKTKTALDERKAVIGLVALASSRVSSISCASKEPPEEKL